MNAGRFDRRIEIQSRTEARDNHGGPSYTWATHCLPWANVREGDGSQGVQGDSKEAVLPVLFTIRYRSDIQYSMRILYQDQYYLIEGLSEITRRGYLQITARVKK